MTHRAAAAAIAHEPTSSRTTSSTSTPLAPAPAPSSVSSGAGRAFLGTAQRISDPAAHPVVHTSGRYTVEYDTSEVGAFDTIVDATHLQQVGLAGNSVGCSPSFFLASGHHTIGLEGSEIHGPAKAYLVGPLP